MIFVGDNITGYCDGHFGRDSYGDKLVLAVGRDWIVVRERDGIVQLAQHTEIHEILAPHVEGSYA